MKMEKKMICIFMLFVMLEVTIGQMKTYCPSREFIAPCVCKIDNQRRPWITCSDISSLGVLQSSMKGMVGYAFSEIFIDSSDLGRLPSDLFMGMEVQNIKISFTNLTRLGDGMHRPPFLGLENSVESIDIIDVFIDNGTPLNGLSISHLKKLNHLELTNNFAPVVPNDWFESGPYSLNTLIISTSSTEMLGNHVFASLVNLKQISLTGSKITSLSRSMFPNPARRLSVIDFSNNGLSSLPQDLFRNMPSLTEVYFDYNAFTEINELSWYQVWNQLTHVYFFGNPINCDEKIRWVYKYRLPEVLGGTCIQPENLKDKELNKLTLKDLPVPQ